MTLNFIQDYTKKISIKTYLRRMTSSMSFWSRFRPLIPSRWIKVIFRLWIRVNTKNFFRFITRQGFIQAILMSGRRHKKLNLLIQFLNSIFIKLYFETYRHWTCIQNKLACYVSSILSYLSSRCKKTKVFQGIYPPEAPPGLPHEAERSL